SRRRPPFRLPALQRQLGRPALLNLVVRRISGGVEMSQEITPKATSTDAITAAPVFPPPSPAIKHARPNLMLAVGLLLGFALGLPAGFFASRLWKDDGVQEGVAVFPRDDNGADRVNAEVVVFYKIPFAGPPQLTFPDANDGPKVQV